MITYSQGAKSLERPKMEFRRAHLVDGQDLLLWLVLFFSDKNPLTVLKKSWHYFFSGVKVKAPNKII